jgi:hypothetical protein
MKSETRDWLRRDMRARWPLVSLLIGIVFASIMFLMERVGRRGGWWPDSYWGELLLSISAAAIIVVAAGAVTAIAKRVGGGAS